MVWSLRSAPVCVYRNQKQHAQQSDTLRYPSLHSPLGHRHELLKAQREERKAKMLQERQDRIRSMIEAKEGKLRARREARESRRREAENRQAVSSGGV